MTDTTSAAAVQIPAVGTCQLDPAASTVTFATRHLFGLGAVKGTFRLISGQITIADPVTSSTASAVIGRPTRHGRRPGPAGRATGPAHQLPGLDPARPARGRGRPGVVFGVALNTATYGTDAADAGVASALVNTNQQIGGSIGTALLNTIVTAARAHQAPVPERSQDPLGHDGDRHR